jgi:hypothetical protein
MKKILFSLALIPSAFAIAQPVIVNGDNIATTSYSYPVKVNLGYSGSVAVGANQTWDFSAETGVNAGAITIYDPATTPLGSNFLNSNFGFLVVNMYSYLEITPTEMLEHAETITSLGDPYDYSLGSKKILQFPFSYGNSFTDSYATSSMLHDVEVTYAGYGTLILPGGLTFENVVLVSEMSNLTNEYRWYTTDPLMSIVIFREQDGVLVWIEADPSLLIKENETSSLHVFPNPVNDILTIERSSEADLAQIEIYSINGKLIKTVEPSFQNGSMNLSTCELDKGAYVLVIGNERIKFVK